MIKIDTNMKKTYIIPSTTSVSFLTRTICQAAIGSVHGGDVEFGGESDGSQTPF